MYSQIDTNKRKTVILIAIFVAVILVVGWTFGKLSDFGYGGLIFAVILSSVMTLVSYYQGDKIALWTSGAKQIQKENNPYVFRMVENLCITAGLPVPKVYIMQDPSINAFATGRDPHHASIAITTGAIEKLENEELEGVVAHELSHVKNYDIRIMTIVIVLVGILVLLSDWFLRLHFFGGRRSSDRSGKGGNIQGILMLVGFILLILSPIIAELIKLAISKKREYLADASGALLTRYPQGLANALEKIAKTNIQPMASANNATAHLFIASPFGKTKKWFSNVFNTHPPIEERIRILREMA